MSKKIKIFFTLSIMLNILLLGVISGMVINKLQYTSWKYANEEFSPESRHLVARSFQKAHKDIKSTFEQSKKARKNIRNILAAEEFDLKAFEKAMCNMQSVHKEMMERKIKMMIELAQALPLEERVKLSGKFMKPFARRKHSKNDR